MLRKCENILCYDDNVKPTKKKDIKILNKLMTFFGT